MNFLAETYMNSVDWQRLRTAEGPAAGYVPRALRRLAEAPDQEAAIAAFRSLDNGIVIQARVFEAAAPVVSVLLPILEGSLSVPARRAVLDLLLQITCGWTDPSESDHGNPWVSEECRRRAREGIWTIYGQLLDPDPQVRDCALEIVATIDLDRQRVARTLTAVADKDPDEAVADLAKDLLRRDRGVRQ